MSAARSLWRGFAATLRIVALLAFAMSSPGHAHQGAGHGGAAVMHAPHVHAFAASVLQADHHDRCSDGLACAKQDGSTGDSNSHGSAGHGPCSCLCGCQSVVTGVAVVLTPRMGRPLALRPSPERTFSSLTPDILPRPPRPFA